MARIFVGNLPMDIKERELDDLFYKYGRIKDIDLKTPSRPPAYAFISFDDYRDAEDAVRGRDNYDFDGHRLRVEFCKGRGERDSRDAPRSFRENRNERGGGRGRRSEWRVNISGLPNSASWQDLKDYMRKGGDVIYADVDHRGSGVVEYSNEEDMENAIRKLDDTEFKNPFDRAYIRVRADKVSSRDDRAGKGGDRDASKSVSRSRSREKSRKSRRSPSHSSSRSRSESRDRDRRRSRSSDSRSKSRSPSRSHSRDRKKSESRSKSPSPKGSDNEATK